MTNYPQLESLRLRSSLTFKCWMGGGKCTTLMKRDRDLVGWGLQALFSRYGIAMLSTRYSTCSKQDAARTVCSDGRCRTKGFANSHDCILIL